MKKAVIKMLIIAMLAGVMSVPVFGATEQTLPSSFALLASSEQGVSEKVISQKVGEEQWLFIPSYCDLKQLTFSGIDGNFKIAYNGVAAQANNGTIDLSKIIQADIPYRTEVSWSGKTTTLNIMRSKNVPALFLTSADPAKNRAWVEASPDKSNKAKGNMTLIDADGSSYSGELTQIKGRGNSTWIENKKPYQIKLKEKVDLINGDSSEAHNTWVLLTNYSDNTLLGNRVMFDLASDLGLEYSPNSKHVDLYYDGEYRGTYLLSEKIEVDKGRVDIRNLEKEIETMNPDVIDMDALPTKKGNNSLGLNCQWVEGLSLPDDYSGGYLIELDYMARALEEKSWFSTSNNRYYTVKSPEYLPKAGMEYISTAFQELENAVFNKGVDPKTGKKLSEIADLHSMAAFFLVEEISYDFDAYVSSSYLYKDASDDLFHSGPVWDFDAIVGRRLPGETFNANAWHAGNTVIGKKLLESAEFRKILKEVYMSEFTPLMGVLLDGKSNSSQNRLRSLKSYRNELAASEAMNRIMWSEKAYNGTYSASIDSWKSQLDAHNKWLKKEIGKWTKFLDVASTDWFAEDLEYVYNEGIMNGVSDAYFDPHGTMNRAMATTILYRIAGAPAVEGVDMPFTDVPNGDWYTDAVKWGESVGLTEGYPDGTFGPTKNITREELATMLYRYVQLFDEGVDVENNSSGEYAEVLNGFVDKDSISEWATIGLSWAVKNDIMKGTDLGELLPRGNAERCQAAAMFHRFMTR